MKNKLCLSRLVIISSLLLSFSVYAQLPVQDNKIHFLASPETILFSNDSIQQWNSVDSNYFLVVRNKSKSPVLEEVSSLGGMTAVKFESSGSALVSDESYIMGSVFAVGKFETSNTKFSTTNGLVSSQTDNKTIIVGFPGGQSLYLGQGASPFWGNWLVNSLESRSNQWGDFEEWKILGSSTSPINMNQLLLGTDRGTNDAYWSGYLAELIIYEDELTEEQIRSTLLYLQEKYHPVLELDDALQLTGFCDTIHVSTAFKNVRWVNEENQELIKEGNTLVLDEHISKLTINAEDYFGNSITKNIDIIEPNFSNSSDPFVCFNKNLVWDSNIDENLSTSLYNSDNNLIRDSSVLVIPYLQNDTTIYGIISDSSGCFAYTDTVHFTVDRFSEQSLVPEDTALCFGNQIKPVGEGYDYEWSSGLSNQPYIVEVTETVSIEATNTNQCISQDTVGITLLGTAPSIQWQINQVVCTEQAGEISVDVTSSSSIDSIQWLLNDTLIENESFDLFFVRENTSDVNFSIILRNEEGCYEEADTTIQVFEKPTAAFDSQLGCDNELSLLFDRSFVNSDMLNSWEWRFSNDTTFEQNTDYRFDAGSNTFELIVGTPNGCFDTLQQSLNNFQSPSASFVVDEKCIEETSILSSTSTKSVGDLVGFRWVINTDEILGEEISYSFNQEGYNSIQHIVVDDNNCADTIVDSVFIEPLLDPIINGKGLCEGNEAQLFFNSNFEDDELESATWYLNNDVFNGDSISFIASEDLQGILTITTSKECVVVKSVEFELSNKPTADFSLAPLFGAPPLQLQISNSSTDYDSILWSFGDGNSTSQDIERYTYQTEGDYNLELSVYSDNGCFDTKTALIEVVEPLFGLEITQFGVLNDTLFFEVINTGSITENTLNVRYSFSDKLDFEEVLKDTLSPNSSIMHFAPFKISAEVLAQQEFYCVSVTSMQNGTTAQSCLYNEGEFKLLTVKGNPETDLLEMEVLNPFETTIGELQVYDEVGYRVLDDEITFDEGVNTIFLSRSELGTGMFIVKLLVDGESFTQKIVFY